MNRLTLPLSVLLSELRRSLTVGRIATWMLLVAFPVAIITAVSVIVTMNSRDQFYTDEFVQGIGMAMYFLIPEVSCLLGLLLWATPAISTEVEGQTWVYLTMRPQGKTSVLLGKYLTSVIWTVSAALVAVALCCVVICVTIAIAPGHLESGQTESAQFASETIGFAAAFDVTSRLLWVQSVLCLISCVVHAALYLVIGVVFYRRTMVAAVLYTVIVEYVVSFIPALVNKFTVNYRLRGLLADWMGWDEARSQAEEIFGSEPASTHLQILAIMVMLLLCFAVYRVERTEYPTQQET